VTLVYDAGSMRAEIGRAYAGLDAEQRAAGLDWYPSVRRMLEGWSDESGYTVEQCAGALAALSPSTKFADNVRQARAMVIGDEVWPRGAKYSASVAKALRILAGENPRQVIYGKRNAGAGKVWQFYLACLGFGCALPVDRHGLRIALGLDRPVTEAEHKTLTARLYRIVADAYRDVAFTLGLRPIDLQASTWIPYGGGFVLG